MKAPEQFNNYSLAQIIGIIRSHGDEAMENAKDKCILALVAKGEVEKERKFNEKVVCDYYDLDATDDEFTSEEKGSHCQ